MSRSEPTYIGEVQSVSGSVVSAVIRDDLWSSLVLVAGESYRVGQVGAFMRIPMGYAHLYGVCSQVGAAAIPESARTDEAAKGNRWVTITLFGEAIGGQFERGVSQYPTVGDEVHLVTTSDLATIYGSASSNTSLTVGTLAAASGIDGRLDLGALVARHCAVVGSTGSGKSNFVATLLESIVEQGYSSARVLVVDPHGEYGSTVEDTGYVFRVGPEADNERALVVPFWALPFDELCQIAMGGMQQTQEAAIRDLVAELKMEAAQYLDNVPPETAITADSPIPFSIRRLWYELDDYERRTYQVKGASLATLVVQGSAEGLVSNIYPPANPGGAAPFLGPRRGITRQLELLKSRLLDERYQFLFSPGGDFTPDVDGRVTADIHSLLASWVGHDLGVTVLDVSGLPSEAVSAVVGTVLRIIYDVLFWACDLPMGGRQQPLLIVLDEAHIFLPEGADSTAHRSVARIAKEGRKYGVGLMVVSQRPTEVDSSVLSQCATMISLRLTNDRDRGRVASLVPDDLAGLTGMLPSLRTGEGLVVGEAMPIPSRIRFRKACRKPVGNDPNLATGWRGDQRPDPAQYADAVRNWRRQSTLNEVEIEEAAE